MKKTFAWALSALLTVTLSAQKTISIETDADEVVKLWDNQTAPHSSEETADEELNAKKTFFPYVRNSPLYLQARS